MVDIRKTNKQETNASPHKVRLQTSIIMVNLGTPEKPTYLATMRFLREFLSDRRVINITKLLWYPILYGFILPFRSQSAKTNTKKSTQQKECPSRICQKNSMMGSKEILKAKTLTQKFIWPCATDRTISKRHSSQFSHSPIKK